MREAKVKGNIAGEAMMIQTTQPKQRSLQVRFNLKAVKYGWIYTLGLGTK
jgi:hypothetical protein